MGKKTFEQGFSEGFIKLSKQAGLDNVQIYGLYKYASDVERAPLPKETYFLKKLFS